MRGITNQMTREKGSAKWRRKDHIGYTRWEENTTASWNTQYPIIHRLTSHRVTGVGFTPSLCPKSLFFFSLSPRNPPLSPAHILPNNFHPSANDAAHATRRVHGSVVRVFANFYTSPFSHQKVMKDDNEASNTIAAR